jgi:hypothetical protein
MRARTSSAPGQSAGASQRRATPVTGWAAPVRAQAATAVPAAATHHRRKVETVILAGKAHPAGMTLPNRSSEGRITRTK